MTDNSIDPLEAAQRDCEAAEQHVSDCRDALERAERAAAAAREKLKALSDGREAPKAPPPEVAEVPKAPPPTSGMKGIFTRAPLPETKAERREAQEIAELRSMEEPPCWSSETLLCELRACAASSGAPSCTLATAPLDWGGLARARQAGRLCVSNVGVDGAPMLADACPPVGDFWVVLLPPVAAAGGEGEEEAVVCLGQTAQGGLCGAIGWWPAGSLSKADGPRAAATAARCVAMDDAACAAEWMQHVTVIGLGEGGSAPTPASSNVHAPPPCQLAEAVRGGLLAKRQIRARLQRGGAAEAEKVTPGLLTAACAALHACRHLRTRSADPRWAPLAPLALTCWSMLQATHLPPQATCLPLTYRRTASCSSRSRSAGSRPVGESWRAQARWRPS